VTDPVSGATVTVTAVSSSGADVSVSYDGGSTPPVDTTAPTAVTDLTASGTSSQGGASVSLGWQPATDDTGVTGYRVTRGSSAPVAVIGTSWTDTSVTPGATYTYSVAAVDAAGNLGPARAVTVTVPPLPAGDTTAPTAVSRLKASVKQGATTLTWAAARDDVAVADYEVTRSSFVARTTSTRWSDRPGAGTWTYTVVARDAAGNRSAPASIRVTVR
jgi:chitodextrinase